VHSTATRPKHEDGPVGCFQGAAVSSSGKVSVRSSSGASSGQNLVSIKQQWKGKRLEYDGTRGVTLERSVTAFNSSFLVVTVCQRNVGGRSGAVSVVVLAWSESNPDTPPHFLRPGASRDSVSVVILICTT